MAVGICLGVAAVGALCEVAPWVSTFQTEALEFLGMEGAGAHMLTPKRARQLLGEVVGVDTQRKPIQAAGVVDATGVLAERAQMATVELFGGSEYE